MDCYPEILLPRQTYPILENKDIMDNALVRETMTNVYPFLKKRPVSLTNKQFWAIFLFGGSYSPFVRLPPLSFI